MDGFFDLLNEVRDTAVRVVLGSVVLGIMAKVIVMFPAQIQTACAHIYIRIGDCIEDETEQVGSELREKKRGLDAVALTWRHCLQLQGAAT